LSWFAELEWLGTLENNRTTSTSPVLGTGFQASRQIYLLLGQKLWRFKPLRGYFFVENRLGGVFQASDSKPVKAKTSDQSFFFIPVATSVISSLLILREHS
jgi:hypothetical protein